MYQFKNSRLCILLILGPFAAVSGYENVAFVNTKFNEDHYWPDVEFLMASLNIAADAGFFLNNNLFRFREDVSLGIESRRVD